MRLRLLNVILPLFASLSFADDWGMYQIVSASAPEFVLEVGGGTKEGDAVSVQKPRGTPNQKWIFDPKGDGTYWIMPASMPTLTLTVTNGETKNGSKVTIEKENRTDAQLWSITKQDNGNYTLVPQHAPGMGLDHFGGQREAGARVDLWQNKAGDQHLQWIIKPLAGSGIARSAEPAPPAYTAPEIKPEAIKEGRIETFQFTQSRVFPGTVREVTIFIPAQYEASKPACVYVKTDGYNPREKVLLETMIATKEIPVTVGVFVKPGSLPAPMKGTADRRNRDFEYDAIDDNKVLFLHDELLPFVAKEYQLNLSTDGNDRCISGGSSGGIAAFTAGWHRPEAFSRVYAASGSWVAFRGGHEFPTMVRKFEARPIRAFLTTATHDMENAAGDWFLLDQEMAKALTFSGYDFQFRIIDGKHVAGYMENWREAMAYLWKDWPQRVKAGPSAPRAQEILVPGEDWKLAGEGFKSTRGPSTNAAGEVFFADTSEDRIYRIGLDDKVRMFAEDTGPAHCVSVGADGSVFTVSEKSDRVMRYDAAGKGSVVYQGFKGHSILAMPNGTLYLTSNTQTPSTGKLQFLLGSKPGTIWKIKDGSLEPLDSAGIKFATGMAYRPDQWLLSVAEGHSKWAYSYQIAEDGRLTNKERFFHLHVADWEDDAGPESLCYSLEGRQFIATKSGIQISADDGPTQVILTVPGQGRVTGVAIGGKDKDTLYAFCGNKIWKRKIQQHAMGAWSPWTKVVPNKL
ncbi:MAG: RICIN domain-containing protein [Verrucomicrobiota bacterium]